MSAVFAQFLEDFGAPESSHVLPAISQSLDEDTAEVALSEADLELAKTQAYQEGMTAARAELEAQFEAQMAALQDEHNAQMKQLQDELGQNIARKLAADLHNHASNFAQTIRQNITDILAQLIDQTIIDQSIDELEQSILKTLAHDETTSIKLQGPQDLLAIIGDKLGESFSKIEVIQNDQIELSISFDDQILSTKINEWRAHIGVGSE